ncbi:MAG TPA: DNA mismatch repair protein MutS [Oligoflexia bacterium]|nr:DNA mismatch repair protein MutS [Oligoflexia bacterium]
MAQTTPLMQQYNEIKSRHQDSLLLFRMGDFYELFGTDAVEAAKILDIALTTRNKNDPTALQMCGVPHHALQNYLPKLIAAGKKVALCEQLENPSEAKGIVRRDVVRVISPGTQLDPEVLDRTRPNLTHAALTRSDGSVYWATCDFSTGHFWFGATKTLTDWELFLKTLAPSEVILPQSPNGGARNKVKELLPSAYVQEVPEFYFDEQYGRDRLSEQFGAIHTDAINPKLSQNNSHIGPCAALIKLFQETQKTQRIPAVIRLVYWDEHQFMDLDPQTIAALDLLPSDRTRGKSLYEFLNRTQTSMGARTLREWLLRPLIERSTIVERQRFVKSLYLHTESVSQVLREIYDIERLLTRVSNAAEFGTSNARDLKALAQSIEQSWNLALALEPCSPSLANRLQVRLSQDLRVLARETTANIVDLPPPTTREGGMFRKGFNSELDELIDLTERGEQWLVQYEIELRQTTNISSLKVRFNRVFGYYIEVTKTNLKNVPDSFIRKQTMATAERYITPELKEFEDKILNAEKRRTDFEHALYRKQCSQFAAHAHPILETARAVAEIDALQTLARLLGEGGYVTPEIFNDTRLVIEAGVHPTVAHAMQSSGQSFVPNDLTMGSGNLPSFLLITGPNMGGKSTVMRQTALIVLLAQIGAPVPATRAELGIVDRIFTRIGSADNLAEGASTFMVEMSEMSFILRQATTRSLILVDEIGRGTSTYDGLSLATAIAEHIVTRIGARTLFATHYHELTLLESRVSGVQNVRVGVRVTSDANVEFLYRLEIGASERSYGILVAKLAGLPENILMRAQNVLEGHETGQSSLTKESASPVTVRLRRPAKTETHQLGLF